MEREQIDIAIAELETRLDRLRALYEHYFMGIERLEPSVPRKDVERRVADLRKERFHSTAQRFRFQTMVQRYNTMQQYWSRICREIELGTFRRHRLKAEAVMAAPAAPRAHAAEPKPQATAAQGDVALREASGDGAAHDSPEDFPPVEFGTGAGLASPLPAAPTGSGGLLGRLREGGSTTLNRGLAAGVRPNLPTTPNEGSRALRAGPVPPSLGAPQAPGRTATPQKPPLPSPLPAARSSEQRLPEQRVRDLHAAYVAARRQTNATDVSFDKLEKSLRETEQKLRGAHQGRSVDFEVVIKDGKAILKPKLG